MGFKYINPGYPRLYGINKDASSSSTKNPVNKIYYEGSDMHVGIDFPSECNEIWAKCDFRRYNKGWYLEVGIGDAVGAETSRSASYPLYGYFQQDYKQYVYIGAEQIKLDGADINNNTNYSVMVHSKNGDNGFLFVYLNGVIIYSYNGVVNWPAHKISLRNADGYASIHNVIISDTEIGTSEQVYIVPAKTTDTTMTQSGDTYTATEENQTLKQTIDTDALIAKVGSSDIQITGIGVYSKAHFDGEGLTKLALLQGDTEMKEVTLGSSDYEYAAMWETNMSIEQLANVQLGCKVKA